MLELIISIAIISLMSSIILFDYPDSVIKLNLANLDHRIALLIREAQIRGSSIDSKNSTVAGYGIYVELKKNNYLTLPFTGLPALALKIPRYNSPSSRQPSPVSR